MRIWHTTSEPPIPGRYTGGMGVHIWNIAKEQSRMGHGVTVYCPLKSPEQHHGISFKPWAYHVPKFEHECAFQIEVSRRTVRKLFAEAHSLGKPDIIHCHEWDSACMALDVAAYLNIPCVATLHLSNTLNSAHMTPHHTELCAYYLWWEQEMMRQADAMIAISSHYAKWIRMFNQGKECRVIPNGINISDFTNGVEVYKPDGRTLAFFHGRLTGQKGIDIIAEAAKQSDDILWVLAGPIAAKEDGRCLEDGLYSDLLELERIGKVKLLGMVSQVEIGAWLRICDVAVYPHKRAPFDCAVLEAMACGAAVITTGVDAIAEYAEGGVDALFIAPDAGALANAIRWLEANPERKQKLKTAAANRAKIFSWESTAKQTLKLYREVIDGKNSTRSSSADKRGATSGVLLDESEA